MADNQNLRVAQRFGNKETCIAAVQICGSYPDCVVQIAEICAKHRDRKLLPMPPCCSSSGFHDLQNSRGRHFRLTPLGLDHRRV
ncbi:MAG: hypothetical protein EOS03_06250 [Mesorhizobium sp.]|nr:MAG: hypothetical protein EOS03_06250 [Mesorhizobium sp.]